MGGSTELVAKVLVVQLELVQHQRVVDDDARLWLAENGYDAKMGARPMDRLIQEKIKKPLAEEVLFGSLAEKGGTVVVSVEDNDLTVTSGIPA